MPSRAEMKWCCGEVEEAHLALEVALGLLALLGIGGVPLVDRRRRAARPASRMWPARCASCSVIACSASSSSTTTLRVLDRLQRLDDRELLDRFEHLAAPSDSRGVDQRVALAAALEVDVDRVARRAGLVERDDALLAEDRVDERRLADVGPADDRHLDRLRDARGRRSRRASASSSWTSDFGIASSASSIIGRTFSPCAAEIAIGSPRPSSWNSATVRSGARPSALFTARIDRAARICAADRRSPCPAASAPARPSTRNTTTSDSAIACLVCRAIACRMPARGLRLEAAGVDDEVRAVARRARGRSGGRGSGPENRRPARRASWSAG